MTGHEMRVPTFDSVQPDRIGRASCDEVQSAFDRLRAAAAAPFVVAAPPGHLSAAFALEASAAVRTLRRAFAQHVAATEYDGGLFDEVLAARPRLVARVTKLCLNHREAEAAFSALARAAAAGDPVDMRDRFDDVATVLRAHAALGASLMHEAYELDVSGD